MRRGIDRQQRKCRDRAAADGVVIPPEFEFADRAVSGTKRDREGLNALLEIARAGWVGVVYFESLSRLARVSVITLPLLKELAYVRRVRVVSVSEGIDSAQPNWDLTAGFVAWVHERSPKTLRAAVLRGQRTPSCTTTRSATGPSGTGQRAALGRRPGADPQGPGRP